MTIETAETPAVHALPAQTPNLNKALSQLQGKMTRVKKTKEGEIKGTDKYGNPFAYKYQYADLGDVVADLGPLMAEFGLAFTGFPTLDPQNRSMMVLQYALVHESGEEKTGEWPLGPANQKAQSLGSALTYARRYSFQAATNIVLEDDDDGKHATESHAETWDNARARAQGNSGQRQQQNDGPRKDQVAEGLAKLALRIASSPDKTADDLQEAAGKQAAVKGKLDAEVDNPFGDGRVKLRDVLREAHKRMQGDAPAAGSGPAADAPADGETASSAADLSDPETAFVIAYSNRVAAATEDEQLAVMRPEIGQAVAAKTISPKVAGELSAAVSARRRELAQPVAV
jgi:hypothetical protein